MAQYEDPKTKNLYPSQEWMFENIKNLPEVQKAYPDYGKPGNLGNTLPPETGETQITPTIPKGSIDNLTAMRILMRGISEKAYSKRMGAGLGTITGGLEEQGLGLEGMSGNITSRIINFVENQTRPGIESKLTTMKDIMQGIEKKQVETRQNALTNLNLLISNDAIGFMEDDELTNWSEITGVSEDTLTALKQSTIADTSTINAYVKAVESGQMTMANVPTNMSDKVIQQVDFSKVPVETYAPTTSMKEYAWAGGLAGTGMTPAEWLTSGADAKPPTATQLKVAGYADRIVEAGKIFDTKEIIDNMENINSFELRMYRHPLTLNELKPGWYQQQEQAEKNFINAILRRESGAVISPSEFKEGREQYFPQPGDKPDVLIQKKANRQTVEDSTIREAGSAYAGIDEWEYIPD